MNVLLRAPIITTSIIDLMPRALAAEITIYDSLYVVLAEARDIPLVTADARSLRRLANAPAFAKLMLWVGDVAA
jgi:predicted nucleic acid-binding protein